MCVYLLIDTVMNTTILQLVAIYNIQLHVSALYVAYHQVVQRTYEVTGPRPPSKITTHTV